MNRNHNLNFDDECLSARNHSSEAVQIGRATVEWSNRQTEQLNHCSDMIDEQEYTIDRAARRLRGLTWLGWITNKLSRDVDVPNSMARRRKCDLEEEELKKSLERKEHQDSSLLSIQPHIVNGSKGKSASDRLMIAFSSFNDSSTLLERIRNYRCNVLLIGQCETLDQMKLCSEACDVLRHESIHELMQLSSSLPMTLWKELESEIEGIAIIHRQLVMDKNEEFTQANRVKLLIKNTSEHVEDSKLGRDFLINSPVCTTLIPETRMGFEKQEAHLSFLSENLEELRNIGTVMGYSLDEQNHVLDSLDQKSEEITDKTRMVVRNADRITQRSQWTKIKPKFECRAIIKHLQTGKYLTVNTNESVTLEDFSADASIFSVWRKHCEIIGLKVVSSSNWLGQSLFGSVVCSSSKFGRREEWELDENGNMNKTALLCVCSNWGNGGWLKVDNDSSMKVGGRDLRSKKNAALWSITIID